VDKHIESLNETNPRDWLDLFLIEINKIPEKQHWFYHCTTQSQLLTFLCSHYSYQLGLVLSGIETSATIVTWFLPLFSIQFSLCFIIGFKFLEIQEKMYEELQTVLQGRLPTLDDKDSLSYLNAVIKEVSFIMPSLTLL
jgi:Cytochrome P450